MNLTLAQHYAEKIKAWLSPHCERIEIAGSIRRQRPVCNDVDIVCIPKITTEKDLLGQVTGQKNLLWEHLVHYVANNPTRARIQAGGETPGKLMIVQLPKCQLDLWFATDETWASKLLCRTGSKEHNMWIANRAAERSLHWDPFKGLSFARHSDRIPARTESDIYRALGLEFIDPKNRERDWIAKHLEFGL